MSNKENRCVLENMFQWAFMFWIVITGGFYARSQSIPYEMSSAEAKLQKPSKSLVAELMTARMVQVTGTEWPQIEGQV